MATRALAQRTDDNAVTSAEDAFGKSVGDEQIGIYNPFDVRGFSPVNAGNVRIEGLFFDQQGNVTDRLLEGTTVHVGISAQGYAFPAPTGIADYSLRKPGKDLIASIGLNYGPFGGKSAEVDFQVPLIDTRLGLVAGAGFYRERSPFYGTPKVASYAASLRYKPGKSFEIQPFWSRIDVRDEESPSLIFTTGDFLPGRVRRDRFLGQKWSDSDLQLQTYGVVSKASLAGFDIGFGLFRASIDSKQDRTDLLFATDRAGRVGQRIIVSDVGNSFASTSGELKLSRSVTEGNRRHSLHLTARGRRLQRLFGGSVLVDLGRSQIGVTDFRAEPVITGYGAKTRDKVNQKTFGLGYELRWKGIGELSLGAQKTDYSKQVAAPLSAVATSKDKPWLYSATVALNLSDDVALYGGYVTGLEESDVAPNNAVNRNVSPPAIRTKQKDFGLRWAVSKKVTAVVGVFDVEKPYYNVDAVSVFRQLGTVRNRGIEFSLSGEVLPGVTLVVGSVYLDAKVSGDEVNRGVIGKRPLGTFRLHNIANLNWKLRWHEPLTLTARFESTSDRTANGTNTFVIPARSVTSLGARYKLDVGKTPVLLRANVDNIFNKFGWNVGGGGFFIPNGARRYSLTLAADL